jgi:hypothetical protein
MNLTFELLSFIFSLRPDIDEILLKVAQKLSKVSI